MSTQDLQFVSALGQAILMAILPVLASVAVRWVISRAKIETQKLDVNTLNILVYLAGIAVNAAEQANLSGFVEDKKQYAIGFCEQWLSSRGIAVDLDAIETAIEAAVYEEFNKQPVMEAKLRQALPDILQG